MLLYILVRGGIVYCRLCIIFSICHSVNVETKKPLRSSYTSTSYILHSSFAWKIYFALFYIHLAFKLWPSDQPQYPTATAALRTQTRGCNGRWYSCMHKNERRGSKLKFSPFITIQKGEPLINCNESILLEVTFCLTYSASWTDIEYDMSIRRRRRRNRISSRTALITKLSNLSVSFRPQTSAGIELYNNHMFEVDLSINWREIASTCPLRLYKNCWECNDSDCLWRYDV